MVHQQECREALQGKKKKKIKSKNGEWIGVRMRVESEEKKLAYGTAHGEQCRPDSSASYIAGFEVLPFLIGFFFFFFLFFSNFLNE